jgi:Multiubiquitin
MSLTGRQQSPQVLGKTRFRRTLCLPLPFAPFLTIAILQLTFFFEYLKIATELHFSNKPGRVQGEKAMVDVQTDSAVAGAKPEKHDRSVMVTVNEQPVRLEEKTATGAEIIAAAIKQGVAIHRNFILQEELPNGTSRVIGPSDIVQLRPHLKFTAIAPDDNS